MTSPAPAHRAISVGRLSMARLKTTRAESYPESSGMNDTPRSEALNSVIAVCETIVASPDY
jgi:hypothetical protein